MLETIRADNPWWEDSGWDMPGVERNIFKYAMANMNDVSVLVIKGPKGAGKTFMLKKIASYLMDNRTLPESILYFDCEKKNVRDLLNDSLVFSSRLVELAKNIAGKVYLMLDEVEYIEHMEAVKNISSDMKFKIILTASFETTGMSTLTGDLIGRTTTFTLFPFSFKEFLTSRTDDNTMIQKLNNLEALMRFLFVDPEQIFQRLREFQGDNPDVFDFIKSHYDDYALYGGYPEVVFRKKDDDVFKAMFSIVKGCIESASLAGTAHLKDPRKYFDLLGAVAGHKITGPDYETGDLQSVLTRVRLLHPLHAYNPDKEMRSLMPVQFVLTDHGMQNALARGLGKDKSLKDETDIIGNLLTGQMLKFLYFDEIRNKELYYMMEAAGSFYSYVFCDTLENVYPIGIVKDKGPKKRGADGDDVFYAGFIFGGEELRSSVDKKRQVYFIPHVFLAGI